MCIQMEYKQPAAKDQNTGKKNTVYIKFSVFQMLTFSVHKMNKSMRRKLQAKVLFPLSRESYWQLWENIGISLQKCCLRSPNCVCERIIFSQVLHSHYFYKIILLSAPNDCPTDIALFGGLQCHIAGDRLLDLPWSPPTRQSCCLAC